MKLPSNFQKVMRDQRLGGSSQRGLAEIHGGAVLPQGCKENCAAAYQVCQIAGGGDLCDVGYAICLATC
jgi:hypothetical protein